MAGLPVTSADGSHHISYRERGSGREPPSPTVTQQFETKLDHALPPPLVGHTGFVRIIINQDAQGNPVSMSSFLSQKLGLLYVPKGPKCRLVTWSDTLESFCASVSLLEGQMTLAVLDSSHELPQVLLASSTD